MKKIIAILVVALLLLSLCGCNLKKKIGEKIAENILGDASGGDVDIEDGTLTIEGEDGETTTFGGTEWPKSDLAKSIPEFKDGTVTYVYESTDSVMVNLEEVDAEDAQAYAEGIKEDFSVDPYEINSQDGFTYGAKNDDGLNITIYYTTAEGVMTIMLGREAQ